VASHTWFYGRNDSNKEEKIIKVGILTGGGDAPGINAVLRAIVRKAIHNYGYETFGIKDGWRGLVEGEFIPLDLETLTGMLPKGGSILGTSRTNPFKSGDGANRILKNVSEHDIEAVIAIGGEDTLGVAYKLYEMGLPVVGVPKTIDNDLVGTDYTFGFQTAVAIACEALDRLHTTAESHHRVIILEVMGRYTGWIALEAGIAGGADVILIPEKPFDVEEVCECIRNRQKRGRNFSIIVAAEGAKPQGGEEIVYSSGVDEFGHARFGGVGYYIGKEIEKRFENIDTRAVVLGHLQRGGSPIAFDRVLATRFGIAAIDLVHEGRFGEMVAIQGNAMVSVPLKDVAGKRKTVDLKLYEIAATFFG
jgi:ATP-dependent phosphofructokinase / diphosphate-dependent phosphofructokinase